MRENIRENILISLKNTPKCNKTNTCSLSRLKEQQQTTRGIILIQISLLLLILLHFVFLPSSSSLACLSPRDSLVASGKRESRRRGGGYERRRKNERKFKRTEDQKMVCSEMDGWVGMRRVLLARAAGIFFNGAECLNGLIMWTDCKDSAVE